MSILEFKAFTFSYLKCPFQLSQKKKRLGILTKINYFASYHCSKCLGPLPLHLSSKLSLILRNNLDLGAHSKTVLVTKETCKRILFVANSFCGGQKLSAFSLAAKYRAPPCYSPCRASICQYVCTKQLSTSISLTKKRYHIEVKGNCNTLKLVPNAMC